MTERLRQKSLEEILHVMEDGLDCNLQAFYDIIENKKDHDFFIKDLRKQVKEYIEIIREKLNYK